MGLDKIPDLSRLDVGKYLPEDSPVAGNFNFNLPNGFIFKPTYIQAGVIVFLLFLLVLTFGSLRHRMNHWQLKGAIPGVAFGFILAILLEAILLVGGGSMLTKVLGWKSAPKPISVALDAGREKLTNVLGVTNEIKISEKQVSPEQVLLDMKNLSRSEYDSVLKLVCEE